VGNGNSECTFLRGGIEIFFNDCFPQTAKIEKKTIFRFPKKDKVIFEHKGSGAYLGA